MAALILSFVSLLLQLYTVTLAIRLLLVTKHRLAWGSLAAGLLLILFRRIFELAAYLDLNQFDINLTYTLISFCVSVSMAIGMHLAKRMIDRMMESSERLSVSEAYYRGLMDHGTEAIFIADTHGNYINANTRALELVGYTFDQITNMTIRDLVDREELERVPIQPDRLRDGELLAYRRTLVRAGGERFVAELHTRQLPDGNLMVSMRDISSHVEAQARLAFQANMLDTVQQAVVAFDLEGCVLYHNHYAARMYGWTGRSVLGLPLAQAMRPAMDDELVTQVQECLASGCRWTGEITYLDEHGVPHPAMLMQSPLCDTTLTRIGTVGIAFDISDLKAVELALRESDDRFRMALQNSDIIMFRQDRDLRYTWNHNSKEPSLNDYIVGRTDHQILPTELADRLTGIKREVMASRRGRQFETELIFRNETTYWNCRLEPLFDAKDEVVGVSGVSVNITERRAMEMELRRSESRFRTLADNLPAIVWVADPNGDCSYFSHATIELSGLTHEELTGKQWLQVIHPDEREEFISLFSSAIAARFPFETTLRVRDAGGVYRHVLMRGVPQFAEDELTGYIGTCFDITERLESEQRLRESEARLGEAQRVAHVGSFEFDAATGLVLWSDELFRIFGLDSSAFVPSVESVQQFIHHNDRADVLRKRLEALDRHEEYVLEYRIVRPDGEIRWVRSNSRPTYTTEGGLVKIVGTVIDITSQHHAEAELHQREARFHTFMDNSPAVVFMKDLEGKYLYFNAAFATTFNVALADWIGHDDAEFWPREIAEAFQKVDRQVIDSGQPMQLIELVAHEDGIHQWFSYKFPICDASGKPEALAGIAIDLTEQYRAQAEQAASEQRHRSLVDMLPDGLYIQCDQIVQYASPSLATMLGYSSADDLVGKHVLALFHQDSHELVRQGIAQLDAGVEKLPAVEELLLKADGTSLACEVRAVRTTWNGRPGVQVVVSDVTERNRAEADRRHLEDQLRLSQKLETIGTMAAGIAHDFNNLLVPIIGYSELVASGELHGKFSAEYLQEVLKAAYRAKGLVAQILAFSRQQTGDRKPIRIDSVIDEVIDKLRQASGQSVHFEHVTSESIPEVMADSNQMFQVLMNVCVNATQAMPQGGSITIRTELPDPASLSCHNCKRKLHGRMAHVEITDTGCGMDAATLKRIFDPFFTTKSVGQGTGLGLAVTHGIIAQHSGHICAESFLGKGTTLHIFLPVAEAMQSRFHREISAPVVGGTESILIIDDEPAVAHSHAATLKSLGYKVTIATEARAALDLFGQNPAAIDLVLLDQRMPDLTGDQLAVQMLRLRPDLPIVICSGYSEALNLRSAQDLGIRDVIMKPVVTFELNRALRAALEGRQTTVVS